MAARQLAGRRPLYFTADVSIILLTYFIFFIRRLISKVSGPIVTKFCHMFGGDCNFLNWVTNLEIPPRKNLALQKHQNFGLRDLIANISGWQQDIVDRKTALKTAITPLCAYQIWWTLVHKRRKIGPWIRPTQSTFSDAHVSAHIAGAKGCCPLKISQLVEGDQGC